MPRGGYIISVLLGCTLASTVQAASYARTPEVKFYNQTAGTWAVSKQFFAYDQAFNGGGSIAVADIGSDGTSEIITAAGLSGAPVIRTFRLDGSYIHQFFAYDQAMIAGVNVAAGDVDADGRAEIVTAPRVDGGSQIRVFDGSGRIDQTVGWHPFAADYTGGANVAVGDLNADGQAEIIVGSGEAMEPTVKIFNVLGVAESIQYSPFATDNQAGVSVAVGNVDADPAAEIITATQGGDAWVKIYNYDANRTIVKEFKVLDDGFQGGVNVAAGDIDGDGVDEVIVTAHAKANSQVRFYEADGTLLEHSFTAYEDGFQGGVNLATGDLNHDQFADVVTLPNKRKPEGRTNEARYVRVDLSEQRLYAYEDGYLVNSFLISSGLPATPTPPGEYRIQRKIYDKLYSGPDYYLPHTLYNLQFRPHYYLHGAYWHHNFGHPMSHGCVNIAYEDAEWIYGWMQEGDLTVIEY